jgi:hypothetical protein
MEHTTVLLERLATGSLATFFLLSKADKMSPAANKKRSRKTECRSKELTPFTALRKGRHGLGSTRVETDKQLPVPGEQGWSEQKAEALGPSTKLLNPAACG